MRKAEATRSDWQWRRFLASPFFVLLFLLVGTRVLANDDSVEFPLPEYDDVIFIPVTVSNTEILCFLDSGATVHVFHTSIGQTIGKQIDEATFEAADGTPVNAAFYPVPKIKIGRIELHSSDEERIACLDFKLAQQASGRNTEGAIGMPLFGAKVVQLDFDNRRVRIFPATTEPSNTWGQPIHVSLDTLKLPTISVELPDGTEAACTVDTGCNGSINLSSGLFAKLARAQYITRQHDEMIYQASGLKTTQVGTLASAKIGNIENIGLEVEDGGAGSRIGLQYLRRFLVTLDLGRKTIYLKKGAKFNEPDRDRAVSIGLLHKNGRYIVAFIGRNSRAERVGIQINDELISVGGASLRGKPNAEIRWMYREKADANGHLTLGLRRDGIERNVDVEINK